jgi:hypothetical protein
MTAVSLQGDVLSSIALQVAAVRAAPLPGQPFAWELISPNKLYVVACNNDRERANWLDLLMKEIKRAIEGGPIGTPQPATVRTLAIVHFEYKEQLLLGNFFY